MFVIQQPASKTPDFFTSSQLRLSLITFGRSKNHGFSWKFKLRIIREKKNLNFCLRLLLSPFISPQHFSFDTSFFLPFIYNNNFFLEGLGLQFVEGILLCVVLLSWILTLLSNIPQIKTFTTLLLS